MAAKPAKPAKRKVGSRSAKVARRYRVPATKCGDFGGITARGEPCGKVAGYGTTRSFGRCRSHTGNPRERLFDDPRKNAFLHAYVLAGASITRGAATVGIPRSEHYRWLDIPEYAEAFAHATECAIDEAEAEVHRRAILGVDEPVFHQGLIVGTIRKRSDTLLMFWLNGARPEKYNRQRVEMSGPGGGPMQSEHTERVLVYTPENPRFSLAPAVPASNGNGAHPNGNGNGHNGNGNGHG